MDAIGVQIVEVVVMVMIVPIMTMVVLICIAQQRIDCITTQDLKSITRVARGKGMVPTRTRRHRVRAVVVRALRHIVLVSLDRTFITITMRHFDTRVPT